MKPGKILGTIALAVSLIGTPAVIATSASAGQEGATHRDTRYYDSNRKEYHNWDANEDRSWHQYLDQQHKKYQDFSKSNKKEQQGYWNWRHDHPDAR